MPAGLLATVPVPPPCFTTVSVRVTGVGDVNCAVTLRAWVIVTVQVPVPEQPDPLQPAKFDPVASCAVSCTTVPPS